MPAVSKKQQKFFGIVRAIQKGEQAPTTPETAKAAADMKKGDVKKFASTKHKGLPNKVVQKEELDKNDKPFVKKLVGKLRKGSNTHAKQADDLEKAMNEGVNINEDDGNYFMNKIAKEKGLDLTDPRQRRRANSLARHNAAKGNVNNPAGFSKRKKRKKIQTEGNLHKWFKGSKSKDGKGGWVNVVTGGTCASDEPGEGTPKCVSSSKRASMTKAERLSAARRKKKADPNQQSKSGAAKPTYVSTDKPKKKKVDEAYGGKGSSRMARLKSIHPPTAKAAIKNIPDDESDRGSGNKAAKRAGKKVEKKSPTYRAYVLNKEDVEGRKTALTDTKTKDVRLARKKDSEIRREAERSMYDTSAGESEIARRTRIAKKLRGSTIAKNQEKGKQMEIDTTKKLVGEGIKRDEYGDPIGGPKISKKKLKKNLKRNTPDEDHTTTTAESYSSKPSNQKKKAKLTAALDRLENLKVQKKMNEEAWQRKEGKNQSGGLNEKGRKSYERANPGSDLKAPSKKKGNKRRKSFCARMKGMKSKLTSAKTARDPDSRINKSLRAWNCSYEPENGEIISESNHKKVAKMIKTLKRKTRVLEKGQKRDAGAIAAKIMREKEHNKYVNFLPMDEEKKKCGDGEYYCNDDKKCKPIPKGYRIGYGGYLKPENKEDESNGKKGGSNGNGNGNGGNGNGHGGNGNGGNGGGNGGGE